MMLQKKNQLLDKDYAFDKKENDETKNIDKKRGRRKGKEKPRYVKSTTVLKKGFDHSFSLNRKDLNEFKSNLEFSIKTL